MSWQYSSALSFIDKGVQLLLFLDKTKSCRKEEDKFDKPLDMCSILFMIRYWFTL